MRAKQTATLAATLMVAGGVVAGSVGSAGADPTVTPVPPVPGMGAGPAPGPVAGNGTGPAPGPATAPADSPAVAAAPTPTPAPAPADPNAPAPAQAMTTIDREGQFAVGTEIAPGTYSTPGPADGDVCYWKRIGGADGASTVDNALTKKPAVVQIAAGDTAFKTSGCQPWTQTTAPAPAAQTGMLPSIVDGTKLRLYIDDVNRRAAQSGNGQLPPY